MVSVGVKVNGWRSISNVVAVASKGDKAQCYLLEARSVAMLDERVALLLSVVGELASLVRGVVASLLALLEASLARFWASLETSLVVFVGTGDLRHVGLMLRECGWKGWGCVYEVSDGDGRRV